MNALLQTDPSQQSSIQIDALSNIAEDLAKLTERAQRLIGASSQQEELATSTASSITKQSSAKLIRKILRARDQRSQEFPGDLFADPAWDMLLELYWLELEQHRASVSRACKAARVPATTALRWLKTLETRGFIRRDEDPYDGRRVFVSLTPDARQAMQRYVESHLIFL